MLGSVKKKNKTIKVETGAGKMGLNIATMNVFDGGTKVLEGKPTITNSTDELKNGMVVTHVNEQEVYTLNDIKEKFEVAHSKRRPGSNVVTHLTIDEPHTDEAMTDEAMQIEGMVRTEWGPTPPRMPRHSDADADEMAAAVAASLRIPGNAPKRFP